ncbi:HesA/MoeB/ThiF family protein [Staphylococcus massiliensis]|uniref:HesA/MoeB/ThiF family protein n=1 Tax=Staphylococcus massiliensis S46 TaxID=1229783 RepID=K9B480_9STAP|nr:ThiF family adenylyltransferase [Staphylococcus massiliensis]EKU48605.1 HesA/MoeB/ThiF family protein [Staphylococcus massiliensis S46]MCG3400251.1 ThiF family adenylyltransferase [Staphylococcus massiliensis]MCG3401881.1 ThiF family adenylyltransferase [Staphylococcus massiliensis]PNZ98454.1 dinucleotide-utilizing protein [Staphylococcus massiliensis CCUG 55927]
MIDRYDRQKTFHGFGDKGQSTIENMTVMIAGVGALGSGIAEQLTRSGVKRLIIVDKDIVTLTNLQRQSCYTEADVSDMLPKVVALKKHLNAMNRHVEVVDLYQEIAPHNIVSLMKDYQVEIVLDGLDNYEVRYLLNEATHQLQIPYIYGAAIGSKVSIYPIAHKEGPCLNCIMPDKPETMESCDINGVLTPTVYLASSLIVSEFFYYVMHGGFSNKMTTIDIYTHRMKQFDITNLKEPDCKVCQKHQYDRLMHDTLQYVKRMCGGVYQYRTKRAFDDVPSEIEIVKANPYVKKLSYESFELTFFRDGRVLIYGAEHERDASKIMKLFDD